MQRGHTEKEAHSGWSPSKQGPDGGGLPDGIKGSMTEESMHSFSSQQRLKRYREKVKLCCNFAPLEINSPFKGITHLTPSWYLGVYQYSHLLSNDIKNALYKGPVSSPHSPSYFFLLSHEKSSELKIKTKTNKHSRTHMHTHSKMEKNPSWKLLCGGRLQKGKTQSLTNMKEAPNCSWQQSLNPRFPSLYSSPQFPATGK